MKASLALSVLSLASTAFASDKVEDAAKIETPVADSPVRVFFNSLVQETAKLGFAYEAEEFSKKNALEPMLGFSDKVTEFVNAMPNDKEKDKKLEETIQMIEARYNELSALLKGTNQDQTLLQGALLRVALDVKKYTELMKLLKDNLLKEPLVETEKISAEADKILKESISPAVNAANGYFFQRLASSSKNTALNTELMGILKNSIALLFKRFREVKKLSAAQVDSLIKSNNLKPSDNQFEQQLAVVANLSSEEIKEASGIQPAEVKKPEEANNTSFELSTGNSEWIWYVVVFVVIAAVATIGYLGVKIIGSTDSSEDALSV